MNDRELVTQDILNMPNTNLLIELPTGYGKTLIAIELLKKHLSKGNVLIVVPKNILKKNFMSEINKWWKNCPLNFTFTTYISLHKYIGTWDTVIYDEAHHISERCRELLKDIHSKYSIMFSATISQKLKIELSKHFNNLGFYKKSARDAINKGILPDPKVYLIPLELDNTINSEQIIQNAKYQKSITVDYKNRWNYIGKTTNTKLIIRCTKRQFMIDFDSKIEYWKKRYMISKNEIIKNKWLKLCGDRLKILSNWRTDYSIKLLKYLDKYRTLTFCNSIEQTQILGKYCINSKNKSYQTILSLFNSGKINHITACSMLDEGANLSNCQIGIYAILNSSERLIKQKLGRLLRHEHPIIIIPYFIRTREEELVKTMIQDYNPELISIINDIKDIQL